MAAGLRRPPPRRPVRGSAARRGRLGGGAAAVAAGGPRHAAHHPPPGPAAAPVLGGSGWAGGAAASGRVTSAAGPRRLSQSRGGAGAPAPSQPMGGELRRGRRRVARAGPRRDGPGARSPGGARRAASPGPRVWAGDVAQGETVILPRSPQLARPLSQPPRARRPVLAASRRGGPCRVPRVGHRQGPETQGVPGTPGPSGSRGSSRRSRLSRPQRPIPRRSTKPIFQESVRLVDVGDPLGGCGHSSQGLLLALGTLRKLLKAPWDSSDTPEVRGASAQRKKRLPLCPYLGDLWEGFACDLREEGQRPQEANPRAWARPPHPAAANQERGLAKTQRPTNPEEPHRAELRQWARPGEKRNSAAASAAGFESGSRLPAERSGAARRPISGGGGGPRTLGPLGPAPRSCLWCRPGRGSRTTTLAGRRRRRSRALRRPPAAAEPPDPRGRPGLAARHVGEHGRAAAPGHDQPVRAGRGLRGRPGEAAAAGGPLAVRDRPEHVFPRNQHSQQPPPPPDDVHPQQHARHAAQLPRRAGHVLQAARLRRSAERQQPHDGRGLLAPRKLQPLLGPVPPQPPGPLDPALLPHLLPPPPLPTARLAPRSPAGRRPAEGRGGDGRPEMRLDARAPGCSRGQSGLVGTQEGRGGGSCRGQGVS